MMILFFFIFPYNKIQHMSKPQKTEQDTSFVNAGLAACDKFGNIADFRTAVNKNDNDAVMCLAALMGW